MPTGPPVNKAEYVALLKVLVAVNVLAAFSRGTLLAAMPFQLPVKPEGKFTTSVDISMFIAIGPEGEAFAAAAAVPVPTPK
jgi:hypothetical protein